MCILKLTEYPCGHAEKQYMNGHCECSLIVGPVVQAKAPCTNRCAARDSWGLKIAEPLTSPKTPAPKERASKPVVNQDDVSAEESAPLLDGTFYAALWADRQRR